MYHITLKYQFYYQVIWQQQLLPLKITFQIGGLLETGLMFANAIYHVLVYLPRLSIILEVPNSAFGSNQKVGIWCRVLIPKDGNPFFQIDRMGRPFVNVAFTKQEDKNTFNRIEPTEDRKLFTEKFSGLLESFGHSSESAQKTALTLLPDILDYDYSSAKGYPNGRKLTDDIIDLQLAVLTNGRVTTDKVGPHQDLLTTFPYLGSTSNNHDHCRILTSNQISKLLS